MLADFEGWRPQPASPVVEALAAVRAVTSLTGQDPVLLGVTPVARANPFQSLLYRDFYRNGIAVAPVTEPMNFPRLTEIGGLTAAVHLHWLSFVLARAATAQHARAAVQGFEETLDRFRSAGGQVVWTVHNLLPHDAVFPDEEVALRNVVAEAATVVHVMSPSAIDDITGTVTVDPARVVVAPHPSYLGAHPDTVTREEARLALGIEPDEVVYVLFGAIKPYKGLSRLLDSFHIAHRCSDRRLRLLIAGQPDDAEETRRFVDRCLVDPDVLIRPSKVPAEQVQFFLRAADVGLAPYTRVLNSGSAVLYTTFGLPCVVPDEGSVRSALVSGGHVAFDGADDLPDALLEASRLSTPQVAATIRAHAENLAASGASDTFARELRARLTAASTGS